MTVASMAASDLLRFSGMTHLGVRVGFDLKFHSGDPQARLFLHVGDESRRVEITGTNRLSRQDDVLSAIDATGRWGQVVPLWMTAQRNGSVVARTPPVDHVAHVRPYEGPLSVSGIAHDVPRMTYPGVGIGRLLWQAGNGRRYFVYGGRLETDPKMRGFDCTSFPMVLLGLPRIASPGYGKQVCEAAGAESCQLEQISSSALTKRFRDGSIAGGGYIVFSAGHVMLYDGWRNVLHEFNFGGFRSTPAALRPLHAAQNLWWVRRLPATCRPLFA